MGASNKIQRGTLPLLTTPLSAIGSLTVGWLQKPKKVENRKNHQNGKTKIVSLHSNISDAPFDQRFQRPPEEGVLNCHTYTERQRSRLYDWIGPVGQFSENYLFIIYLFIVPEKAWFIRPAVQPACLFAYSCVRLCTLVYSWVWLCTIMYSCVQLNSVVVQCRENQF